MRGFWDKYNVVLIIGVIVVVFGFLMILAGSKPEPEESTELSSDTLDEVIDDRINGSA